MPLKLRRSLAALFAATICLPAPAEEQAAGPASESECWRITDELAAAAMFSDLGEDEQHKVFVLLDRLQDECNAGRLPEASATSPSWRGRSASEVSAATPCGTRLGKVC